MTAKIVLHYSNLAIAITCVFAIVLIGYKRAARTFAPLVCLLAIRGVTAAITVGILFYRRELGLEVHRAYAVYFYSYWISAAVQVLLQFLVIYSVYRLLMKPLEGLQEMGKVVFRWITAVSLLLSLVLALGPHAQSSFYMATLLGQVQEGESVLTVCLLVFVTFATKPLGLSFRSRAFGVLLGLGFSATAGLVLAAWLTTNEARSVYAPVYAWGSSFSVLTLVTWMTYFAIPEPERKMILLPTTSPYLHWNQISEALGDDPGMVAVGGVAPAMFASAELEAFLAGINPDEHPAAILSPGESLALEGLVRAS